MPKIRSSAIVIKYNKVLLIHRKNEREYYSFPGGTVEEGETPEQTVLRELKEETTIEAKLNKFLKHTVNEDGSENFTYLCDYISGEPKLAEDSQEKIRMKDGTQYYNPEWIDIGDLKNMTLWPKDTKEQFFALINTSL